MQNTFDGIFFSTHIVGSLFNCLDSAMPCFSSAFACLIDLLFETVDQSSLLACIVPGVVKHAKPNKDVKVHLYLLSSICLAWGKYVAANILPSEVHYGHGQGLRSEHSGCGHL